jgi:sterol desaturase/sphingolipid hydroxylase (fatty acid hydroxylase superfamily)
MDLNPVILAIPMYFALMGIELVYESISRKKTYRLNDAITNISTCTLQQLTGTFLKIFKIGVYAFVFQHFAFFEIPADWTSFIILFFLFDLCYYWDHRMAHRISLFWGGHSVHHQSEDYNLSVALRQSSTAMIWGMPFYLPLALIGFDPVQFAVVGGFNLLYQFWIHTEHINKLPRWFEWFFNTPSHHRVHHGRDPKYIDKNYAGVFIIYDRMFGTFQKEEERPNYGITKPLNSWNPVYANFAHYIDLYHDVKKTRSAGDALKVLFYPPGWRPEYLGGPQRPTEVTDDYHKYNKRTILQMNLYIFAQFLGTLGLSAFYFFKNEDFSDVTKVFFAIWIIVSTLMFGFLFESSQRWLVGLEVFRLLVIPVGLWAMTSYGIALLPIWLIPLSVLFSAGSIFAFLFLIQKTYKIKGLVAEKVRG